MKRNKRSLVWEILSYSESRWPDPIFLVLAVGLGSLIGQERGLLTGLMVAFGVWVVRNVLYLLVFHSPRTKA